jgi:hypothetical protein
MLFGETKELFYRTVTLLRLMSSERRHMALYAAEFWSHEKLMEGEAAGDLPGNPGALVDEPPKKEPHLKIVS